MKNIKITTINGGQIESVLNETDSEKLIEAWQYAFENRTLFSINFSGNVLTYFNPNNIVVIKVTEE